MRNFSDLTEEEVREIVQDIFKPEKITCVRKYKKDDEIQCKIYTRWGGGEQDPEEVVVQDELTMRNPFVYGIHSIDVDFSIDYDDVQKLKKYCFAKGITFGLDDYLHDNPYLKKTNQWFIQQASVDDAAELLASAQDKNKSKEEWKEWLEKVK